MRYQFGGGPGDVAVQLSGADNIYRFSPGVTVEVFDSGDGGNQLTDLWLTYGGPAVPTLTSSATGRLPRFWGPEGVATLWLETGDSERYILTSTDVGDQLALKQDADAPPAPHTHGPGDVPTLAREVAASLAYVFLDTTVDPPIWPARPATPGPVVWIGNAAVPSQAALGTDYIDQLTATGVGSTVVPDPTPTPTPTPDPTTGIALSTPVVSVNGNAVSITVNLSTTTSTTFVYAQIAVRDPSGAGMDPQNSFNNNVTVGDNGTLTMTGTLTATAVGTWKAYGSYNQDGGSAQSDWIDGPVATFTIAAPTTPTPGATSTMPQAGKSGLAWNSGCYSEVNNNTNAGIDSWSTQSPLTFGSWRGKPADAQLVFADRSSWTALTQWNSEWTFDGIFILAISPQPTGQNNSATAAGSNNGYWTTFANNLKNAGHNTSKTVLRLGWEANGDWYDWSWKNGGATSFIAAYKNVVNTIKAVAPNVKFDLTLNKDIESQGGMTWEQVAAALINYFDILSIDAYDMYTGWRNSSSAESAWQNAGGPQRNSVMNWCKTNGKLFGAPEWGLVDPTAADGTGGGDDVLYITETWNFFSTNSQYVAYETYFNCPGSPSTFRHTLTNWPNAAAAYRATARWGTH